MEYYNKIGDIVVEYYNHMEEDMNEVRKELSETEDVNTMTETKMTPLEKLQKMTDNKRKKKSKPTKKRSKKIVQHSSNILTFFKKTTTESNTSENSENSEEVLVTRQVQQAILYDSYLNVLDFDEVSTGKYNPIKECINCKVEKILRRSEGSYVCPKCGEVEHVIIESERPNYKDQVPDKPGYPYKRINVLFSTANHYLIIFVIEWKNGVFC